LETQDYDNTTTIEITISNWKWLNSLKGPGDSFNNVITKLKSTQEAKLRISEEK